MSNVIKWPLMPYVPSNQEARSNDHEDRALPANAFERHQFAKDVSVQDGSCSLRLRRVRSTGAPVWAGGLKDADSVMAFDPETEVLICTYSGEEPALTLTPDADGTQTLCAAGQSIARIALARPGDTEIMICQQA